MNLRSIDLSNDSVALERLISDIEEHDLHPALGERKVFDLVDPRTEAQSASCGLVAADDHGIFAYLPLVEEEKGGLWTLETVVHPDHRRPSVLDALLKEATRAVIARGGEGIRLWGYVPEVLQAAERSGFRSERELFHMRAPLPLTDAPRIPPGIRIRGFQEGIDDRKWLEGNNQVFFGHPENGNWELADLDRRRRRPWFSSEGFRMAWDGEVLAGFCWTKTPSPRAGEIYVIGVLPDYQGMGLGRALLLEGIGYMYTHQHARACVLYVDAANSPALRMYRSMGFRHHHTDRSLLLFPKGKYSTDASGYPCS